MSLLPLQKKKSFRCRCCLSKRFIWTAVCGAHLDAQYWHGREVDRSADLSIFGYRGKHRHYLYTHPPFFSFFLPLSIPRLPTRRKGVGEGKARTHPHILYCTRCAGCCRQHEVNRLLETGTSSLFFYHLKHKELCRSWFIHLSGPEGAYRMNMAAGMYENTA